MEGAGRPEHGIVNLLKPPGPTSHDVVAWMRRLTGIRRVGHAGTLDPGAAGVLPLCLGEATKVVPFLQDADKAYRAEMTLGIVTDTQDALGRVVEERPVRVERERLEATFARFVGEVEQVPPMASAVRVQGRRLYELARAGLEVARPTRRVQIYALKLVAVWPDEPVLGPGARVLFDVHCSKGTYIRTLCADVGEALGCGAHLSFLVRMATGPFRLPDAVTAEEFQAAWRSGQAGHWVWPIEAALPDLPALTLTPQGAQRLRTGQAIGSDSLHPGAAAAARLAWLRSPEGDVLALAAAVESPRGLRWQPRRLFLLGRTASGRGARGTRRGP